MVAFPASYSWVPTGKRSRADGSPAIGGSTHFAVTCWTVDPAHVPRICHTSTVASWGIGAVRTTTGPLPSPVFTPLTNTLISEPGTNWRRVISVSPSCTGPTCGAGRAEHGCTMPIPGGLGPSPGHSCCVAVNTSPEVKGEGSHTRQRPPQHGYVPTRTPPRERVNRAPFTIVLTMSWVPPS